METTVLCRVIWGLYRVYGVYIVIMEKKMETTVMGLHRV